MIKHEVTPDDEFNTTTFGPIDDAVEYHIPPGMETDPTGRGAHEAGAKLDSGKIRPSLVLGAFAHALWAVCEIGTYGANKYSDNGWQDVPNGLERYDDALLRHWMKDKMGEMSDQDTDLLHQAHLAWNALAVLERMIVESKQSDIADEVWNSEMLMWGDLNNPKVDMDEIINKYYGDRAK